MTRKQIEEMMAKQKEVAKTKPFMNTEMGQYAYQLGFEDGADWALSHQWVSVEDEMPPKGDVVIAHYETADEIGETFATHDGINWWDGGEYFEDDSVTHWMPIPPIAEKGGEK